MELRYEDLDLHNFRNSRHVLAGLTVSDLAKAAVLAPLNLLLVGDKGSGKTLLASDIYDSYFGGNKGENGHGIMIRAHPEIDIHGEIFSRMNIEAKRRELTDSVDALIYVVDEINRAPPVAQNQFFGLGDGKMDFKGKKIQLGRNGYRVLIATANIGNGQYQGTFETDTALFNRLHVALDFDYRELKPTRRDLEEIKRRSADPNVRDAPLRDLSEKVLKASREIGEKTEDPGLEARAVLGYLEYGLENCQRNGVKDKVWPLDCQDCTFNGHGDAVCSRIRQPVIRTMEVVRKYAAALHYLAKLKDPKAEVDPIELVFKSFELTGAYQDLLNPRELKEAHGNNPKLMHEVVEELKKDYRINEDYILTHMEMAEKGQRVTRFFKVGKQLGNYDDLKSDKAREGVEAIEPFIDSMEIGLSWVPEITEIKDKLEKETK